MIRMNTFQIHNHTKHHFGLPKIIVCQKQQHDHAPAGARNVEPDRLSRKTVEVAAHGGGANGAEEVGGVGDAPREGDAHAVREKAVQHLQAMRVS